MLICLAVQPLLANAFSSQICEPKIRQGRIPMSALRESQVGSAESPAINRRSWVQQNIVAAVAAASTALPNNPAWAATRPPLGDLLYTILRVREATEQETRLIKSGKFKDVQRANVKLAVRFMVENYRLADAFVNASAYLDGNDRRIAAGDIGQAAVQNLVTILEYFDSSDVQNLKVCELCGPFSLRTFFWNLFSIALSVACVKVCRLRLNRSNQSKEIGSFSRTNNLFNFW